MLAAAALVLGQSEAEYFDLQLLPRRPDPQKPAPAILVIEEAGEELLVTSRILI